MYCYELLYGVSGMLINSKSDPGILGDDVYAIILKILNFVAFYLIWFACLLDAHLHTLWIGPLSAFMYSIFYFYSSETYRADLKLSLIVTTMGTIVDTLNLHWGVFYITGPNPLAPLPPLWLITIWYSFTLTLRGSMSWLHGRYILASICGAFAAPISYFSA